MTNAVARVEGSATHAALDQALLKAVGLDRVPAEQRTLALHIAERYGLDLMLRHIVMVDGKPYITRDGLLHVAHRSGVFDGIEVTDPVEKDGYWCVRATVYRKDMSRGIAYPGRYPVKGKNATFAQEMGIKVAEVMALRRAFDVSAPSLEERWDLDESPTDVRRSEPRSLTEKVAARRADIEARPTTSAPEADPPPVSGAPTDEPAAAQPAAVQGEAARAPAASPAPVEQCPSMSPYDNPTRCQREAGHSGTHRNRDKESWS
jgi:hypothetical protein